MARVPLAKVPPESSERDDSSPSRETALPIPDAPLVLVRADNRLELRDTSSRARLRVQHNAAELKRYRSGGRDPFRRAIGAAPRTVVDATAGLGYDSVHLAALGYQVTAIERNPIVDALARDGLERARREGLLPFDNPIWLSGDARTMLPLLETPPASVYLDPMFPPRRKKSAAVRKEMHLLRMLLADDDDATELLALARACAFDRVVVKRPLEAPPLAPDVSAAYAGKLVRYDMYRPTIK